MKKKDFEHLLIDRDFSWVSFNGRVLQEAANPEIPIMERIKFLAIFSSNLDEFFRVRFSGLKRLATLTKESEDGDLRKVNALMRRIKYVITKQQDIFEEILEKDIVVGLRELGINMRMNDRYSKDEEELLRKIFEERIEPLLFPQIISLGNTVFLKDQSLYHFCLLRNKKTRKKEYGIVNIPSDYIDRFIQVKNGKEVDIFYIDDLVAHFGSSVFPKHDFKECFSIKLSRDADIEIKNEYAGNLVDKIKQSLIRRSIGLPSRLLFNNQMPNQMLWDLQEMYQLEDLDLIEGDRYHKSSDFFNFPNPGDRIPTYPPQKALSHRDLDACKKLFPAILKKDYMVHYPYHNMDALVRLVEESAEDPKVKSIKISLYRAAKKSKLLKAIIRAAKNGKEVTAFVEVKARFDETPNLKWADKLEKNNVRVVYSMPGIKVHCKVLLITRIVKEQPVHVSYLSTGNFNENTAKIYCDDALFTGNQEIGFEIDRVFDMLQGKLLKYNFKHLLLAPFDLKSGINNMIQNEIEEMENGHPSEIIVKVNGLDNNSLIGNILEAAKAGVKVKMIVRGVCTLAPPSTRGQNNVEIRSIVGRYLEHSRIMYFYNGGKPKYYLGSADWMNRNMNSRVEVMFPVYDPSLQEEIKTMLDLQLADNLKARKINQKSTNRYLHNRKKKKINSQSAFYKYLKKKHKKPETD